MDLWRRAKETTSKGGKGAIILGRCEFKKNSHKYFLTVVVWNPLPNMVSRMSFIYFLSYFSHSTLLN
jgi:hypothetical protein